MYMNARQRTEIHRRVSAESTVILPNAHLTGAPNLPRRERLELLECVCIRGFMVEGKPSPWRSQICKTRHRTFHHPAASLTSVILLSLPSELHLYSPVDMHQPIDIALCFIVAVLQ